MKLLTTLCLIPSLAGHSRTSGAVPSPASPTPRLPPGFDLGAVLPKDGQSDGVLWYGYSTCWSRRTRGTSVASIFGPQFRHRRALGLLCLRRRRGQKFVATHLNLSAAAKADFCAQYLPSLEQATSECPAKQGNNRLFSPLSRLSGAWSFMLPLISRPSS